MSMHAREFRSLIEDALSILDALDKVRDFGASLSMEYTFVDALRRIERYRTKYYPDRFERQVGTDSEGLAIWWALRPESEFYGAGTYHVETKPTPN